MVRLIFKNTISTELTRSFSAEHPAAGHKVVGVGEEADHGIIVLALSKFLVIFLSLPPNTKGNGLPEN